MNYKETDIDKLKNLEVGQVAALYAARRSILKKYATGAALVKDGKVVGIGWSHVGHIRSKTTPWSTHAEAHLLQRVGFKPEGCDLYIATISSGGNLTLALPCESCERLIEKLGPAIVHYTTPDDEWRMYDPNEISDEWGWTKSYWKERGY